MKYKLNLTIFLLLVFASSFGQHTKIWLEKAVVSKDSSSYYFKLAKKNSKTLADEAAYYSSKNLRFSNLNELDSAIVYGIIAIKKTSNTNDLYNLYLDVSDSYRLQGQYDKAIDLILKGLKIAEANNNAFVMAKFNMRLSLNYHDFESYKKGVFYGKRGLYYTTISKEKDKFLTARIINAIAINFDDWNKADSALYYHYKVFDYVKGKDTLMISRTYNNIGNTLLKQKKYKEAEKWVKSAIVIANLNRTKTTSKKDLNIYYYEQATHYNNLANIAYELGQFDKAETLFDQSFYYATNSKSAEKMRDYYQHRYLFNRKRNNLKETAKYQEKYITLRDSVFDIERAQKFAELETKYQTEKKEKALLKSKAMALESDAEIKKKNFQFILLFVFIFGIIVIFYLLYRQQKQKNNQQKLEYKLKKEIAKVETQNKLQEQRLSISRDLHDNIGAQLTFIISSVDNIKYAFDIKNQKLDNKLATISSFAKDTIVELRDTMWAMNTNEISIEDLKSRILNFIEKAKMAREDVQFDFIIQKELNEVLLTSLVGMHIYRVIQEAINNAMKYANATKIEVTANRFEKQLKITIQDNGIGFDLENIVLGNGLNNMKKRVEEVNGSFYMDSKVNEGTTITFII